MGIGLYAQNVENSKQITEAFGRCKGIQGLSLWDLEEASMIVVMLIAAQLTSLDITYALLRQQDQLTDLFCACVNLENLQGTDILGDRGLREVGTYCTKLRMLEVQSYEAGFVTQHGLMELAKGCFFLEEILFYATDMSNEALETLAKKCLACLRLSYASFTKTTTFTQCDSDLLFMQSRLCLQHLSATYRFPGLECKI